MGKFVPCVVVKLLANHGELDSVTIPVQDVDSLTDTEYQEIRQAVKSFADSIELQDRIEITYGETEIN